MSNPSISFARCLIAASLLRAFAPSLQPPESTGCGRNIVSPTVVASYCGHRADGDENLDLLILWRGNPGWFQLRGGGGGVGAAGSATVGPGMRGQISQYASYGDVTIGFDADFDADTVTVGDETVSLKRVNTIRVDFVDEPRGRRIIAKQWIEPRLPLAGDVNVELALRSRELLDFLQCEIPMPAPPALRFPRPPAAVVTVCEKLNRK